MLKNKNIIWFLSFTITIFIAIYQRITGPTYPVKGKIDINGKNVRYYLPRSCTIKKDDCIARIYIPGLDGYLLYKRYNVNEDFKKVNILTDRGFSYFRLNSDFPKAAKIEYEVYIRNGDGYFKLNPGRIILRFKGDVSSILLFFHIAFMFLFMLFSTYIFLELNINQNLNRKIFYLNYFFMVAGVLSGTIVQFYAFDKFWSGFPVGNDLTDNKSLVMFILWTLTMFSVLRSKDSRKLLNFSFIMTMLVYLIPHSLFGSEYDFSTNKVN